MNQILVILHFLGFALGLGSGVANMVVGIQVAAAPGDAPVFGRLMPIFARVGQAGLALLWITGLILVWSAYGGPGAMPPLFWAKIVAVLAMTALVVVMGLRVRRVQQGDRRAALALPMLGRITGGVTLLILILAVYAFS